MPVPPEWVWLIPVVIPFAMGLLVGTIIKRTMKLAFCIIALLIILATTGYVAITYQNILEKAMEFLPKIIETGMDLVDILPYSSTSFLIGLALGLWKS